MKFTIRNLVCRILVIALTILPFQTGQASMIGTDQAMSTAAAQGDRNTLINLLSRAEMMGELQSLGIDSKAAMDRVAAMTDDEVRSLAGKVNAVPAAADGGLVLLILVVFFIWYFAFRR